MAGPPAVSSYHAAIRDLASDGGTQDVFEKNGYKQTNIASCQVVWQRAPLANRLENTRMRQGLLGRIAR
jgi:hypothetical protein